MRIPELLKYTINYLYRFIVFTIKKNEDNHYNYSSAGSQLQTRYRFILNESQLMKNIHVTGYHIQQIEMIEAKMDSKGNMIVTTEIPKRYRHSVSSGVTQTIKYVQLGVFSFHNPKGMIMKEVKSKTKIISNLFGGGSASFSCEEGTFYFEYKSASIITYESYIKTKDWQYIQLDDYLKDKREHYNDIL